jgi:hypothetical protein
MIKNVAFSPLPEYLVGAVWEVSQGGIRKEVPIVGIVTLVKDYPGAEDSESTIEFEYVVHLEGSLATQSEIIEDWGVDSHGVRLPHGWHK